MLSEKKKKWLLRRPPSSEDLEKMKMDFFNKGKEILVIKDKPKDDLRVRSELTGKRFYRSEEWLNCREEFLKKQTVFECVVCDFDFSAGHKHDTRVLCIDHKNPLRFNWSLRCDMSNLQILCNICNGIKANTPMDDFKCKVKIVSTTIKHIDNLIREQDWDTLNKLLEDHDSDDDIHTLTILRASAPVKEKLENWKDFIERAKLVFVDYEIKLKGL